MNQDLDKFKEIVNKQLNIDLFSYKEDQLNRRLLTYFQRNNIEDIEKYARSLGSSKDDRINFLDFITINVTEFHRNPELYKLLSQTLKDKGKQNLKIWSAACSSGCEPYGIAILLKEMGFQGFTIHATDIDPNIINKAKEGIYEHMEIRNLPQSILNKYFKTEKDKYYICDEIKRCVHFETHDLLLDKFNRNFDLILCRNVVIYFKTKAKEELYHKLSDSLAPEGILFVGATENIHDYPKYGLVKLSSFIYTKV